MLLIFTGNGKGKTTASFGVVLRSLGWNKKVCIIQFVKTEKWPEGVREAIKKYQLDINLKVLGSGFVGILGDKKELSEHKKSASDALSEARKIIKSGEYDLIVLDEILGALHGDLLTKKGVEDCLDSAEEGTDIILTGRHAPEWLIDRADLVTEMKEIKHPYSKGKQAERGIDF